MEPVTAKQLDTIEQDVRVKVEAADVVKAETVPLAEARAAGAMMLFGEKYPDPVRMVSMGTFSKELCGGTHLSSTSDVQNFEIVSEEGVAAGTRRVVALTGSRAKEHLDSVTTALKNAAQLLSCSLSDTPIASKQLTDQIRDTKKQLTTGSATAAAEIRSPSKSGDSLNPSRAKAALRDTARILNVGIFDVPERVAGLVAELKKLQLRADQLSQKEGTSATELIRSAVESAGVKVIVAEIGLPNANVMRQLIDQIRKQSSPSAVFLIAADGNDKVVMVAGVSNDLVKRGISAGNWVKEVAPKVGGGGGGKPDMAQAGGKQPSNIPRAIDAAQTFIQSKLTE
jgi:alanyl-tRNA synthetase